MKLKEMIKFLFSKKEELKAQINDSAKDKIISYSNLKEENIKRIEEEYKNKEITLKSVPRIIQLEHTTRCNFECIACNHYYQKNHISCDIDFKVIEKLKEIFPHVEQIQLNGGGEPFIAKGLEDALEIYSHYGLKITTTTNLSYLTDRMLEVIRKNFSSLNLSCDGATKEIFEGIRKNGDFDQFINNVKRVRACNENIRLVMGVTIMRQNISQLPEIIKLAKNIGIDKVVVGRMIPRPVDIPYTVQDDLVNYPNVTNHYLQLAKKMAAKVKIIAVIPNNFKVNSTTYEEEVKIMDSYPLFPLKVQQDSLFNRFKESVGNKNFNLPGEVNTVSITPEQAKIDCTGNCNWLFENVFINAKGDVSTCCQMANYSMGNLLEVDSFYDIWNSDNFKNLRKAFWDNYIPNHCYGCQFIPQNSLTKLKINQEIDMNQFRSTRFK